MKLLDDFVKRFNTTISLDDNLIVKTQSRYFLLNPKLKRLVREGFFHAGTYLGKVKNSIFFPSFPLLAMIAEKETSNKVIVDENTEWLFICGRDIFQKGILKTEGVKRKGDHTLVLNTHGECLGFGRLVFDLNKKVAGQQVAVKNISDLGDFLRREKTVSR
jgi:ribosome biogenesis protein Nip4